MMEAGSSSGMIPRYRSWSVRGFVPPTKLSKSWSLVATLSMRRATRFLRFVCACGGLTNGMIGLC